MGAARGAKRAARMINQIDKAIEQSYYKHAAGKQISIMQITQVYKDARVALLAGASLDDAMPTIVARYCEPSGA